MPQQTNKREFVLIMALLTSMMALAIDSMLPAFDQMSADFELAQPSDIQHVIAALFLGFGIGQVLFGPLSDAFGRKWPTILGSFIFVIGSGICYFSPTYEWLLLGRALQGFGGAGPRIISVAMVRDSYSGNAMAQITSLIMTIFVFVPAIAPSVGHAILIQYEWPAIFLMLILFSVFVSTWFFVRQPETLEGSNKIPLTVERLSKGALFVIKEKTTVSAMLMSGALFGVFMGYLGSIQNLIGNLYSKGEAFPFYFAILALSVGSASLINSKLVMKLGMRKLISLAFSGMTLICGLGAVLSLMSHNNQPEFWLFMLLLCATFITVGILFGNINALGMEPLGKVAGIGSSLLGSTQMILASVIGYFVAPFVFSNVFLLFLSFSIAAFIGLLIAIIESKRFATQASIRRLRS